MPEHAPQLNIEKRVQLALKMRRSPYDEARDSALLHLHTLGNSASPHVAKRIPEASKNEAAVLLEFIVDYPHPEATAYLKEAVSRGALAECPEGGASLTRISPALATEHQAWCALHEDITTHIHADGQGTEAVVRGITSWVERPSDQYRSYVENYADDDNDGVRHAALQALEQVDGVPQTARIFDRLRSCIGPDGLDKRDASDALDDLRARQGEAEVFLKGRCESGDSDEERDAFVVLQALRQVKA